MSKCEVCEKRPGAYSHVYKVVICEPCRQEEGRKDEAFDARCDEDPGFEDWASGSLD